MSDDPQLDALLGEVAQSVDDDLEAGAGVPDLLAVVELAHRLDASRVPQAAVVEVSSYAPIVSLKEARRQRDSRNDTEFQDIVREVRGHVDQDVARALGARAKEPPVAEPPPRQRRWAIVAVAAMALLGVGIGIGMLRADVLDERSTDDRNAAQLSPRLDDSESATVKHAVSPPRAPAAVRPAPTPNEPPTPEEQLEPVSDPDAETETETDATASTPAARTRPSHRRPRPQVTETLAEKLDRLEREANAAWKAGRHADAESIYRTIIKLDRRGSWAESAYGELFTLRRQRGKDVTPQWRAYLKRFPKGRFADDATAGLCRRAAADDKVACWTRYLDTIPKGSFRQQAHREIEHYGEQEGP